MSSPAASCALMIAATASRYCSRNSESPSADLNDRPPRLASYHKGRGYDPVIAVGSTMSRVVFNIIRCPSPRHTRESGYPGQMRRLGPLFEPEPAPGEDRGASSGLALGRERR